MSGVTADKSRPLEQRLAAFGCTELVRLDETLLRPAQLNYLDLLPKTKSQKPRLSAVAEHQGTALLYVVDACGHDAPDSTALGQVCRDLANRSDPAWLGVARPGALDIYPIGFHEADGIPSQTILESDDTAPLFFQRLVHGAFPEGSRSPGTDYVFQQIFKLLSQTTDAFVPKEGKGKLNALEVLSMAGRALFFRFLIDREIVKPDELGGPEGICRDVTELKDVFSTASCAAQTSAWLDETYNGDFLPLIDESIPADDRPAREEAYLKFYKRTQHLVGKSIFRHLEAILKGWSAVGQDFQLELDLDWNDFDFAHIPVGVLSQVYESFSHRADPRTARDTSVHYTPRTIASLMVDQAFAPLKDKASAKVLDSACGAGIFLVLSFRRLVHERWQRDEERPRTEQIQEILYQQLRGFDISESALRLAALSLYITAIELNASPRPPKALKFPRNLRGEVLYQFADDAGDDAEMDSADSGFVLGSLGPEVPESFEKAFDIVIGNPPWTSLREGDEEEEEASSKKTAKQSDVLNDTFTAIGRRVLEARGESELAADYQNPGKNPDIPFLWRAMEWARDRGVIALAMPARLFGRTTGLGYDAWRAILQSVEVTGLINGADLRKTPVWDAMDVPFCIFFARNAKPGPDHRFHYAAPASEPDLNKRGIFRIDYEAAQPISVERVVKQPWILKALSFGTWLDVEVMEGLVNAETQTLRQYWKSWDPEGLKMGEGINRSPKLKQTYVDFLADLKMFEKPDDEFLIDYEALRTYGELYGTNDEGESSAHMPRRAELFQPPLVIVRRAPGDNPIAPRGYISDQRLAFSKSNYGYSCSEHPEADSLAALIYLLVHSTLLSYFLLMTSRNKGFDRQLLSKEEFDALPFPDLATLSSKTKATLRDLAQRLQHSPHKPWDEIDAFLFQLYGLDETAVQVARDTLFAAGTYRKAGRAALERSTRDTRAGFLNTLRDELEPYFEVCGEQVAVREAEFQPDNWREPWFFLSISKDGETVSVSASLLRAAMKQANARGCSRIMVNAPGRRGLVLGLLNQRRWWTSTRARLCAQHIIRERLAACGLPEQE